MDLFRQLRSLVVFTFVLSHFSTVLARHYLIHNITAEEQETYHLKHHHLHDRFKRDQGAGLYLPESFVTDTNEPESGNWEEWSSPSPCSRTCGGGVATQQRECARGYRCTGPSKKHFSCNTQDCPDDLDFREQQCARFNAVPFEGVTYDWIPYTKAPNKCELNCMPRGERFYYRHSLQVTDGTRCDDVGLDVCVQGQCQSVGCDHMLGSAAREDKCRKCGGDGASCNSISGLLDMQDLQVGYNDILLIPAGATNVHVYEIHPSNNYLAVRNLTGHYYLNGNWRIDFPKSLRFAGTLFQYQRQPQGFAAPDSLSCLGPTTEPLYIVLLSQDRNVGVKYEYSVSKEVVHNPDPDSYNWIFDAFSECSASCGGGYQTRRVYCVGRRSLQPVDDTLCDENAKYSSNQSCNTQPCPPEWRDGPWSECSDICGPNGVQSRRVYCERIVANGVASIVEDEQCNKLLGPRPTPTQECNRNVECPKWHTAPWKACDKLCDKGKKTRVVVCYRRMENGRIEILPDEKCDGIGKKPNVEEECQLRPCDGLDWITSEWSNCDQNCGPYKQTRQAFCATKKGQIYPEELCEKPKPELVQDCPTKPSCTQYLWFSSDWTECSAKCGQGKQTRIVFCGLKEEESIKTVATDKCDQTKVLDTVRNCTGALEKCPGEWFGGPWGPCSKECGDGIQARKVFCMDGNKTISTSQCEQSSILFTTQNCNTMSCGPDDLLPLDVTKSFTESDDEKSTQSSSEEIEEYDDDEDCEDEEDEDEDESAEESEEFSEEPDIVSITNSNVVELSSEVSKPLETFSSPDLEKMYSDAASTYEDESTESTISEDYDTGFSDYSFEGSGEESTDAITDVSSESSKESTISDTDKTEISTEISTSSVETSSEVSGVSESSTAVSGVSDGSTEIPSSESSSEVSAVSESSTDVSKISESSSEASIGTSDETSDETSESSTEMSGVSESSTDVSSSSDSASEVSKSDSDVSSFSESSTDISSGFSSESSISTEISSEESTISEQSSGSSSSLEILTDSTSVESSSVESTSDSSSSTDDNTSESSPSSESSSSTEEISSTSEISTESSISTNDFTSTVSEVSASSSEAETETSSAITMETSDIPDVVDVNQIPEKLATISPDDSDEETESSGATSESSEPTSESSDLTSEGSLGTSEASEGTSESSESTSEFSKETSEFITETSASSEGISESSDVTSESSGSLVTSESSESTSELSTISESSESTVISSSEPTSEASSESSSETSETSATEETSQSSIETSSAFTEVTDSTVESSSISSLSTEVSETSESSASSESSESTSELSASSESAASTSEVSSVESSSIKSTSESWESTILELTTKKRLKKCKPKKRKCKKSQFGCCSDERTPAKGPFQEGCPTPKTCNETKFGCCPDGVSPAHGKNNKGCPDAHCSETLFGCCPDGETVAQGNDKEGCKKEPELPKCTTSKFGCCADNSTEATGENKEGCPPECIVSEFGCCADNLTEATGKNNEGCIETSTTTEEVGCAETTFGCCPDNSTAATGENMEGCVVINKENCTASHFGCCPDNQTAALGSKLEGCKLPCQNSRFGCCRDNVTPAHGPAQEGCCIDSPFGCCPDNILYARGPNNEGCDCHYNPYGCCPDNVTAATGRDFEGCSCENTPHGCCPDKLTNANGPNFEGCPCHTFQFGCCDDGVTAALGPRKMGCGCQNSEFKCCSDGKTPAKGPNNEGCDCASSKYDCCPDGVSEAQGPNFEGCENIPTNTQDACKLEKDRGSCRNYTVKWFYDMEYGGCSRFWYGGCEGNDNRFRTNEECRAICVEPEGKDVCQLPKVKGPCEGYYPTWYYDNERKHCAQFVYGGCLGNKNRFQTREDCTQLCAPQQIKNECELPKEEGPCNGTFERYFFNKESSSCERFRYGGCKGNGNNFRSEAACYQKCLEPGKPKDDCYEVPKLAGNCTEKIPKWSFDQRNNRCMPFYYTGCGQNGNNFDDLNTCTKVCPPKVEKDVCDLPAEAGDCYNYAERWYYDTKDQRCRQFYYGGCGGNQNNFKSELECNQRCEEKNETVEEPFRRESCLLAQDAGVCYAFKPKWFYDTQTGVCRQFTYGGCLGNQNNFDTQEECQQKCRGVQDICALPQYLGACESSSSEWFYNRATDACEQLPQGRCQLNDNRFSSQQQCQQRCTRQSITTTQNTPTTIRVLTTPQIRSPEEVCYVAVDPGTCSDQINSWYYNPASQKCESFVYTGCGGNQNRYTSEEQCERSCGRFRGQDVCRYPKDTGPCRALIVKYYYEARTGKCDEFYYGGCEGNGNRFSTLQECQSICAENQIIVQTPVQSLARNREAVCTLPVAQGNCGGGFKQWFYDDDRASCIPFVYTGCSGNDNRFASFEECMTYCYFNNTEPEPPAQILTTQVPCTNQNNHCLTLKCPFGMERRVDEIGCDECICYDPCHEVRCPQGSRCVVDLKYENDTTIPVPQCRLENKPGQCPLITARDSTKCAQECYSDADCRDEDKCCATECGAECVSPTAPEYAISTESQPAYTEQPVVSGVQRMEFAEETEPELDAEEGYYVTIRCVVRGFPVPQITWSKDRTLFIRSMPRIRLLSDGSLQIVNLNRSDAGIYICTAENGITQPIRREYQLRIIDPRSRPASIIEEDGAQYVVTLGAPYTLPCYAMGWPRPSVIWWRGDTMLPFSSPPYTQERDFSLTINPVQLRNLGSYTCQAYNGQGRAASWTVTLLANGPVDSDNPIDINYFQYLKNKPKTTTTVVSISTTKLSDEVVLDVTTTTELSPRIDVPQRPRVYTVPVVANISLDKEKYGVGEEISIPCNVEGYPIPKVQWYKDGVPVRPSVRLNVTEGNRLIITDAKAVDSGEYTCDAQNQYSHGTSSIRIFVEGNYVPPGCTDNPFFANCTLIISGKRCNHEYYRRFCCKSCTLAGHIVHASHGSRRDHNIDENLV